jgi:hypothetical protein
MKKGSYDSSTQSVELLICKPNIGQVLDPFHPLVLLTICLPRILLNDTYSVLALQEDITQEKPHLWMQSSTVQ